MSDRSESSSDFVRALLAWFAPPIAVLLQVGLGGAFFINLFLTLLGWLPGAIHAAWVIAGEGQKRGDTKATFFSLLACGFFPPLAVYLKRGLGADLLINLVLVWFMWLPGILHATWVAVQQD